jgi:hypothetical protein
VYSITGTKPIRKEDRPMSPLLIAGIVVLVLFLLAFAICCAMLAGKADDELERKYGIRRS